MTENKCNYWLSNSELDDAITTTNAMIKSCSDNKVGELLFSHLKDLLAAQLTRAGGISESDLAERRYAFFNNLSALRGWEGAPNK